MLRSLKSRCLVKTNWYGSKWSTMLAFAMNLIQVAKTEASGFRGNDKKFGAGKAIDRSEETYWTTDDNVKTGSLTMTFTKPVSFNRFLAQEYIKLGQRVKSFTVEAFVDGAWKELSKATTIGYKRILRFPTIKATKFRFTVTDAKSCPLISNIAIFNTPQILAPPTFIRERSGDIRIIPADAESQLYFTTDGSLPTAKSLKYTNPIKTNDGKVLIKSIAYDSKTGNTSAFAEERFDIARKLWKIVGISDDNCNKILDGNSGTEWYQDSSKKMPFDLVIDLGKIENVNGSNTSQTKTGGGYFIGICNLRLHLRLHLKSSSKI